MQVCVLGSNVHVQTLKGIRNDKFMVVEYMQQISQLQVVDFSGANHNTRAWGFWVQGCAKHFRKK